MTQVVSLRGEKVNDAGVNEAVVDVLCEMLIQAQRGEIIGLAAIAVRPNNEVGTFVPDCNNRHLLLAGTVYLQRDIAKD